MVPDTSRIGESDSRKCREGKVESNQDPTMLLYLVVRREIIDIDISPPRPTTKKQEFF
jgi:hypothetical protein